LLIRVDAWRHYARRMKPSNRYAWYAGCSAAILTTVLVVRWTGVIAYDPDRPPGGAQLALPVLAYVLFPAVYGMFAIIPALGRAVGRGFFVSAIVVGIVSTTGGLTYDLTFNEFDCWPDCVPAVGEKWFFVTAFLLSLVPTVVAPLLWASVRWPQHRPTAPRGGHHDEVRQLLS
jgi:hypothetical protein